MRIEAAGKTWIVEEQELERGFGSGWDRLSGVSFQNVDHEVDRLFVRWVLTPERLTLRLAQELFELAAVRLWQDPRDDRPYRLNLESRTAAPSAHGVDTLLEAIRFESETAVFEAPWTLDKPLGWASDAELIALLDLASEEAVSEGPRLPGA